MIFKVLCFILYINFAVSYITESSKSSAYNESTPTCLYDYKLKMFHSKDVSSRTWHFLHEKPTDDDNDISFRIVGGNGINIRKAPYAVLYGRYCGATLLAPEWVLTAAHCLDAHTFVSAGTAKSTKHTNYNICSHFFHPNWAFPTKLNFFDWDYQLLLLETPIPVTSKTRPIAIGHDEDIVTGVYATVSGWGYLEAKTKKMSKDLQQVRVPIIPQDNCMEVDNKFYRNLTARMFCAGYPEGKMDACQGDSGGPAVINNKLVGLVSFGIGCADGDYPGVYARVPMARPWIQEVTGLNL